MNSSLLLVCLWVIVASVLAIIPSRHGHWPAAVMLIVAGVPLLGYVTYQNGALVGLLVLAAGASVLRWPLVFLWRRLRKRYSKRHGAEPEV
ncbi:DUF2484 family protein [Tropicimonas sp.]|uniref:DUF2484 family protein n=1 Tax=Tropicimonas sp. TaxID=2067044 RepID=UPI003A84B232